MLVAMDWLRSKWGSFGNLFTESGASVVLKWGRETVISKRVSVYFQVGQLFENGQKLFQNDAVTSKLGKMLFQSKAVISKWASYFNVGQSSVYFWWDYCFGVYV